MSEPLEIGNLSRVDPNITSPAPVKIKELLPQDNVFNSYGVQSSFIMKMLSKEQTGKVMEMLAKGTYVRVEKTQYSDSSLVATVRRFSKPTLQEEVEGRTE